MAVWRVVAAASLIILTMIGTVAAQPGTIDTSAGRVQVEPFAIGLSHPWGMVFLPDGRMLVTERPGPLRIVSTGGAVSAPLGGVPEVYARGQGGLLDVALDPDFDANRLVYLSYAEPREGGAATAVARGQLDGDRLTDVDVIFRQQPAYEGGLHFGSRLVFARDGTLFITLGERFEFDPAQDLGSHLGKIVRINPDGSVPPDNPFVGREDALPEIWSYGHRNVQGADLHPETGALWAAEFGPRGGDEVNIPEAGKNYGWPLVSWGRHYTMMPIPDPPSRPDLATSVYHWTPSVSPSGMSFYTGDLFPEWTGDLFLGGLSSRALIRLVIDGNRIAAEERLDMDARIRHVRGGPDGALYLLIDADDGAIWRLKRADAG